MKTKLTLIIITLFINSCAVSMNPDGRPVFSVDPVASQKLINKGVEILNEGK